MENQIGYFGHLSLKTSKVRLHVLTTQGGDIDMYFGTIGDFDLLLSWVKDKCVPFVREITFSNAEVSKHFM